MNNQFGLNNHPMDGPPMHNNRGGMMPSNMQQVNIDKAHAHNGTEWDQDSNYYL